MYFITRESIFFINLRQAYLLHPSNAAKLSSRTVLFLSVPDGYLDETRLRELLGPQVVRVWIPTDTKELGVMVNDLQKIAMDLEGAEIKLIRTANITRLKSTKKGNVLQSDESNAEFVDESTAGTGSDGAHWVNSNKRPTHRVGKFGLYGQKVDTINWCRSRLQKGIPGLEAEQEKHRMGEAKKLNAAFVEFTNIKDAQAVYQSLTHHQILTMIPCLIGMHPSDIIWSNLSIRGWERYIRFALSTTFVVGLVLFWCTPVAIMGMLSNVNYLIGPGGKLPWLNWIEKLPHFLLGIITGLFPTAVLAALMALLPIILRLAARLSGSPTYSEVEYTVQNSYFSFQIIQVFLATTISSAASSTVVTIINNPTSITTILSTSIPRASNFYLSYFILQSLAVSTGTLVGIAGLIMTPLLVKVFRSTPREIWQRWNRLSRVSWGTLYPVYTNLFVIGMPLKNLKGPSVHTHTHTNNLHTAICYSCIAPLVTGFAAIGLFIFYFAYRYKFLFVYDTGFEMNGLCYPRALQHLFVGLYIAELCLVGLFGTRLSNTGAIGPFVLMIVLVVITALYHTGLNAALTPLIKFLPKTLEVVQEDDTDNKAYDDMERGTLDRAPETRKTEAEVVGSRNRSVEPSRPQQNAINVVAEFLKPYVYDDYLATLQLVRSMIAPSDPRDDGLIQDAYFPPAVWVDVPQLIIPKDEMGISRTECDLNEKVGVLCTDEGARLDEENNLVVENNVVAEIYGHEKEQLIKGF